MSAPDRVGTALWSILAGSCAGAAANAVALLLLPRSADTLMIIFGGSVLVAVTTGWLVSRAIADTWRRAITAAICAFGTTLLNIGGIVVSFAGGVPGFIVFGVVLILVALVAGTRARTATLPTA